MHVKARQIAFLGLLAAFAVLLVVLGAVIEMSTLFFICGAAFCVGIAIREWGVRYGAAFLVAAVLAALIVAPNKLYCITFAAMGLYLLLAEILWNKIGNRKWMLWLGKYIVFNAMYIPAIIFMPRLLIAKPIDGPLWIGVWAAGQAGLFVFDKAHDYFQIAIWNKLRKYVIR